MATYNDMNMMSDTSAPKEGEGCEEPAWWSKLIAEFIGTFFLVLTAA
jgi:glycerol uptake facilitator-like aquaporin